MDAFLARVSQEYDSAATRNLTRHLLDALDPDGAQTFDPEALEKRSVSYAKDLEGMVVGRFQLDPVTGAWFIEAIEHFSGPDPSREETADDGTLLTVTDRRGPGQRRADALGLLCRLALRAPEAGTTGGEVPRIVIHTGVEDFHTSRHPDHDHSDPDHGHPDHDPDHPDHDPGPGCPQSRSSTEDPTEHQQPAQEHPDPDQPPRAEQEPDPEPGANTDQQPFTDQEPGPDQQPSADQEPGPDQPPSTERQPGPDQQPPTIPAVFSKPQNNHPRCTATTTGPPLAPVGIGFPETAHGQPLSLTLMARFSCDALLQAAFLTPTGAILDLGHDVRTASRAQRRALTARDRGCIIPGCTTPASRCDAHHITFYRNGGPTDITNLCLLCPRHHTELHLGIWAIRMTNGIPWTRPPTWIDPHQHWIRNTYHHTAAHARDLGTQLQLHLNLHPQPPPWLQKTPDDPKTTPSQENPVPDQPKATLDSPQTPVAEELGTVRKTV